MKTGTMAIRLEENTVCSCLNDTGSRKVEITERCLRCGAVMDSDFYEDALKLIAAARAVNDAKVPAISYPTEAQWQELDDALVSFPPPTGGAERSS